MISHSQRIPNNSRQGIAVSKGNHVQRHIEIGEDGLGRKLDLADVVDKESGDLSRRPLNRDECHT